MLPANINLVFTLFFSKKLINLFLDIFLFKINNGKPNQEDQQMLGLGN